MDETGLRGCFHSLCLWHPLDPSAGIVGPAARGRNAVCRADGANRRASVRVGGWKGTELLGRDVDEVHVVEREQARERVHRAAVLEVAHEGDRDACGNRVFGRMLGPFSSWHGPQPALKCPYRSDRVTRHRFVALSRPHNGTEAPGMNPVPGLPAF